MLCHVDSHCGAYFSNCAVIGHFTCQMAISLGRAGCHIITRLFFSGRVGSGHKTTCVLVDCGALWGSCERVAWRICVAQAIEYPFKAPPPKVLITVNVYTGDESIT